MCEYQQTDPKGFVNSKTQNNQRKLKQSNKVRRLFHPTLPQDFL